jgi:F-type H+-transporting ATPase subunit delta
LVSSEQTETSGVAGRYATALFELAVDRGLIDEIANDLQQLQSMINESADLRRLIRSPLFTRDQQSDAMAAVMTSAGLSELVRNFVGVVAGNRRLFVLEGMIGAYRALVAQHRGEVTADVTSATPLSDTQRTAVEQALKQAIGSNVAVNTEIDPDLIGGMVVRVGSRMVDSSLRTKLQRLQLAMKGAA